jgi:hypothetical protein
MSRTTVDKNFKFMKEKMKPQAAWLSTFNISSQYLLSRVIDTGELNKQSQDEKRLCPYVPTSKFVKTTHL